MPNYLRSSLFINDRDMALLYGLHFGPPQGWADGPVRQDHLTAVPGFAGSAVTAQEGSLGTRVLTLSGLLLATSTAEALAIQDEVNRVMGSQDLEVRFLAQPDRMGVCQYRSLTWQIVGNWRKAAPAVLTLEMPSPYKIALSPDVYAIASGTQLAILLGSAPSHVTLRPVGTGGTNPGVRYRDAQGMIRGELSFPLTLAAKSWIDSETGWKLGAKYSYTPTTPATMIPAIVVDSPPVITRDFWLDPADGDGTNGPTLEAVNCDLHVMVRKAWR